MFEVADHDRIVGACEVHGTGRFAGQVAIFLGPAARDGAEAYARWLNGRAAHQRRQTEPGR